MKKIMFNDRYGLTAAVLQGRKTMTRRVCKEYATGQLILASDVDSFLFYPKNNIVEFLMKDGTIKVSVPPYKNNEIVAVAQNYNDALDEYNKMGNKAGWGSLIGSVENCCAGYSNKMFVKAELMPHQTQINNFNIEHLQNITDKDCMKEGIKKDYAEGSPLYFIPVPYRGINWKEYKRRVKEVSRHIEGDKNDYFFDNPREAFATLINRPGIGRKGLWKENPFVFAYSFKLIK